MAQKRNPVSLRLQTRLQGYEKRFASCWFTDSFFSQICVNDLFLRIYCGHLLQKGGSWYGEVSESRIPESCISLQFLYRKCCILSTILDKRKEGYTMLSSVGRARREELSAVSLQSDSAFSFMTTNKEINNPHNDSALSIIKQDTNFSRELLHKQAVQADPLLSYPRIPKFSDKGVYDSLANTFTSVSAQYRHPFFSCPNKNKASPSSLSINSLYSQNKEHKKKKSLSPYSINQGFPSLSLIECICSNSQENKRKNDSLTYHTFSTNRTSKHGNQILIEKRKDSLSKHACHRSVSIKEAHYKERMAMSFTPLGYWTSIKMIRGVSAYQNIEFCLHSVALLYGQRVPFLKIKEAIFTKLECNPNVRGARIVCSGRQGGRSKSAMRARTQSAILGNTALSLFSSRLAFASTNIDTTFGQIGIKLWICYK